MIYTEDFFSPTSTYPTDDLVQLVDSFTNENVNYVKYTGSTPVIDDGVVFRARGSIFYVLSNYISGEYVNVKQFGATGDGINNDAPIINHAIETTSRLKMRLFIPKTDAFYLIDPEITEADEASPDVKVGMLIQNDMHIFSDGATLKMKDGVSSQTVPKHMRMFFSNIFLQDISISGLILDMNGLNNLMSPSTGGYLRYTQFHFGFSGTKDGVAAGANNVLIENCSFINTAGVTCIAMCQSNTSDVTLGKNWVIKNNLFNNNGLDTNDHSSIYGWANDVSCHNNTFTNDRMPDSGNPTGGQVTYEVHGSNQSFFENTIENYYQGLWVSINNSEDIIQQIYIYDNIFKVGGLFLDFYNGNLENVESYPVDIKNVFIKSNVGKITNAAVNDAVKQFVRINAKKAPSNIFIENNTLISESINKECSFLSAVYNENQQNEMTDIFVNNNSGANLDNGCLFFWGKNMDFGNIQILNNSFEYKSSSASDIKCYGNSTSQDGKILNLVVSNIKSFYSDNNNRAIISGDFSFDYNDLSLIGVTLGNGTVKSRISSAKDFLTINAELKIGSTTTFDGFPISFKSNGAAISETETISDASILKSPDRFFIKGVVDKGGTWCILYNQDGTSINSASPTTLVDQTVINTIFILNTRYLTV